MTAYEDRSCACLTAQSQGTLVIHRRLRGGNEGGWGVNAPDVPLKFTIRFRRNNPLLSHTSSIVTYVQTRLKLIPYTVGAWRTAGRRGNPPQPWACPIRQPSKDTTSIYLITAGDPCLYGRTPSSALPFLPQKVEKYKDRATFVHMYGPEPHPTMPGTNFDAGTTWQSYWSVVGQHRTYEERVGMAERIGALVHPEQVGLNIPGTPYYQFFKRRRDDEPL